MKVLFSFLLLAGLLSSSLLNAQKNSKDQEVAIRKVIENETRSFMEGNYEKWSDTWAHDADSYVTLTSPGGNTELFGWDKISETNKPVLKTMGPVNEAEYSTVYNKYDYHYLINGNLAVVTFKEGKGNASTRILEKQNGTWKIKGLTVISTSNFNMANTYNTLKNYSGKWKLDPDSWKNTEKSWFPKSVNLEVRETPYGLEFNTENVYSFSGSLLMYLEREQFIKDGTSHEVKYFDFNKDNNGNSWTNFGTASLDTAGNVVVKMVRSDNYDNVYTSKSVDDLHMEGNAYDKMGKVTSTWSCDFKRVMQ